MRENAKESEKERKQLEEKREKNLLVIVVLKTGAQKTFLIRNGSKNLQMRHNFSQLPFSHITIKQDRSTNQEKFI